MSDTNPVDPGGDQGLIDGGLEPGFEQPPGDGQYTEPPQEPPKNYLEIDDDVANRYVKVTVDGEELEVPLREALSGYSRTADYTRKTQTLAEQAKQAEYALALQRALQAQPEETLRILARQHGINFDPQAPQQRQPTQQWEQPSPFSDDYEDDYADPTQRQLQEVRQTLQQLQQAQAQREADEQLRGAIGDLQRKYQVDEATVREVVGTALRMGAGPSAFEMIYKNIAYDREQQTRAAAQQQRQLEEQQRQAAAQRTQQLVGAGGSANGAGGQPPGTEEGRMSVREAFEAAYRQHSGG